MSQHREGRVQRCKVDAEKSRQLLKFLVSDCCEGLPDLEQLLRMGG
jgi:ArsR family transcriptional regulator, arsenate/arsenite/antimonite-responsive transcriptional repressor